MKVHLSQFVLELLATFQICYPRRPFPVLESLMIFRARDKTLKGSFAYKTKVKPRTAVTACISRYGIHNHIVYARRGTGTALHCF